jgi:hypothetical protein
MHSLIRSQEIFNPRDYDHLGVTIIGAGAIGSRVFHTLIELGLANITIYDFDIVEGHNLASQAFSHDDIGLPKVTALANLAYRKLGHLDPKLQFKNKRVTPETPLSGALFLLVDSLEERRNLFPSGNLDVHRVIDVRMAATHGNVYNLDPHTKGQAYLDTLGNDADAEVSACGSPFSVAPTAAVLSNIAVWQFIHQCNNPAACDEVIDVFLQPLDIHTRTL